MFKEAVIRSFQKAKGDISSLKKNMSDWILFYNKKHNEHDKRLEILEQRIMFLERKELQKRW